MKAPRTLHEYMEMKNLQRKMQFYQNSEGKRLPVPLTLDRENEIDLLIGEIIKYIKGLLGEGPLYNRFHFLIQELHHRFKRELSQFHDHCVASKLKENRDIFDEIKRANSKLNDYLHECEEQKEKTQEKLAHLIKTNELIDKKMFKIDDISKKKINLLQADLPKTISPPKQQKTVKFDLLGSENKQNMKIEVPKVQQAPKTNDTKPKSFSSKKIQKLQQFLNI